MQDLLTAVDLTISFGRFKAVNALSFELREGEILGVIGPNGAGKSTLMNALSGVLKLESGRIHLKGRDITHLSPAQKCGLGIGRTYQIPRPFVNMTVFENVLVGGVHGALMREREARKRTLEILALVGLWEKRDLRAGRLDLLDRKALEVARALATNPSVLLLDEVAAGLTEREMEKIIADIKAVRERGVTIIWIEHVLQMMLEGVDRIMCMAMGQKIMCGEPRETIESPEVQQCYLGVEEN
ncbi:MAG TPA: ABC transporter ATP-binding protein [Spirochaetia bacterium]|nr:ABC transporter ATP-binding protein [Spirochaetia bacterium]